MTCCDEAGSSAGRAAAVLVKAFRTKNARMGERSNVPPSGGISPRNMFK